MNALEYVMAIHKAAAIVGRAKRLRVPLTQEQREEVRELDRKCEQYERRRPEGAARVLDRLTR